jgi:hypothetical protein
VLVFDSGVGGLSVYDEIRQLLPNLHYIYAFDNVAFPYGEKSEEFIVERVVEIVTAVQQRYPLALAVIACVIRRVPFLLPCVKIPVPGCGRRAGDKACRPLDGERHCGPAGDARYGKASLYPRADRPFCQ